MNKKFLFIILIVPLIAATAILLSLEKMFISSIPIAASFGIGYYLCAFLYILNDLKSTRHIKSQSDRIDKLISEKLKAENTLEAIKTEKEYHSAQLTGIGSSLIKVRDVCERATVDMISVLENIIKKSKEGSEEADAVVEYFMGSEIEDNDIANKPFGSSYVSKMLEQNQAAVITASKVFKHVTELNRHLKTDLQSVVEKVINIHSYVSEIENIATQTRILSINSAIEAARAGQHGRAFSVVSQEVGKLAEHSNRAANKINYLAEEAHKIVDSLNMGMEKWTREGEKEMDEAEQNLQGTFYRFNNSIDNITEAIKVLTQNYKNISQEIEQATVTLQFQDMTGQQLSQIIKNLESTGMITGETPPCDSHELAETSPISELTNIQPSMEPATKTDATLEDDGDDEVTFF